MKKITLLMLIVFTTIKLQGQNKLLSSIDEFYDGASWVNTSGDNYEYDSNNNLISTNSYLYNSSNSKWEIAAKESYVYNANNKITEYIDQTWDSTTNKFINSYKSSYTYTNGKVTEILDMNWDSGLGWVNSYKGVLTYNDNNLPISALNYDWVGSQWVLKYRDILTYNVNNRITTLISDNWVNLQWVSDYKSEYIYNSNNKIVSNKNYNWKSSSWLESDRQDYEWDTNGNRIRLTQSQTGYVNKTEYTYDASSLMSSYANPFRDKTGLEYIIEDFPYLNKVLASNDFQYDAATSSYVNNYRTTYNYNNSITLGTKKLEIANATITVFPNPSNNYIQVSGLTETKNYEVYSILGDNVSKGTISGNEKIDIHNLTNGLYFLKFKEGNTIKFIKE
jgi:hypothetical protein